MKIGCKCKTWNIPETRGVRPAGGTGSAKCLEAQQEVGVVGKGRAVTRNSQMESQIQHYELCDPGRVNWPVRRSGEGFYLEWL